MLITFCKVIWLNTLNQVIHFGTRLLPSHESLFFFHRRIRRQLVMHRHKVFS